MRAEAKKILSEQQRDEILSNLQSKSRLEAMMDIKTTSKVANSEAGSQNKEEE